jgi:hypothetical protein
MTVPARVEAAQAPASTRSPVGVRPPTAAAPRLRLGLLAFWVKINHDWIFNLAGLLAHNFLYPPARRRGQLLGRGAARDRHGYTGQPTSGAGAQLDSGGRRPDRRAASGGVAAAPVPAGICSPGMSGRRSRNYPDPLPGGNDPMMLLAVLIKMTDRVVPRVMLNALLDGLLACWVALNVAGLATTVAVRGRAASHEGTPFRTRCWPAVASWRLPGARRWSSPAALW